MPYYNYPIATLTYMLVPYIFKVNGLTCFVLATFTEGGNFCDTLFSSIEEEALPKCGVYPLGNKNLLVEQQTANRKQIHSL